MEGDALSKEKLIRKFDKQAGIYEIRRKKQSDRQWRERLIPHAKGRVLELAVGAGANFHYYPDDVHVTAVDFSEEMLAKAKVSASECGVNAAFLRSDIEALSYPEDSFDTVVSTLSFCGYDHPADVLRNIMRWCKPEGQILLMEHGISSNGMISTMQKWTDPLFRRIVGCHLDRDILGLLHQSGLHITRMEHYLAGCVHLIWASPAKDH
jgi:ubiquinone/menaquinone biosynthesis C-methylase UbiE